MVADKNIKPTLPTGEKPVQPSGLLRRRQVRGALSLDMLQIEQKADPLTLLSAKYKICEKLGSGCAGVVHKAIHLESGCEVAIKIPLRTGDEGVCDAAKQEYELLKRLGNHPGIIQVLGFHNKQGEAAIVMEFFDGITLQEAVQDKRMSEGTARRLSIQLLQAVSHLHANNILHRDLKPQNVLVSRDLQELRIIDFNAAISVASCEPLTPTGTDTYKAPELLLGDSGSEASDIWACGLCMYYMLSGCLPQDRHIQDVFDHHCCSHAARPLAFSGSCWQHISKECIAMLKDCLCLDPKMRSSISDILEDPWITDPWMRNLSQLSILVPGAEAFISVLSYLGSAQKVLRSEGMWWCKYTLMRCNLNAQRIHKFRSFTEFFI